MLYCEFDKFKSIVYCYVISQNMLNCNMFSVLFITDDCHQSINKVGGDSWHFCICFGGTLQTNFTIGIIMYMTPKLVYFLKNLQKAEWFA